MMNSMTKKILPIAALAALAVLPLFAEASSYQVVDVSKCNSQFLVSCNADETCVVNPSQTGQAYLCVKTSTIQSGMPSVNSFTAAGCNNQCPASAPCVANSPAIPTTYFCSPAAAGTTVNPQPTTDCSQVQGGCQLQYQPLEPLSSPLSGQPAGAITRLAGDLNYLFPILISVGALLGVGAFTVGGIVYMTSSVAGEKSKAVERMKASVWGLLLLVASVLILQIINPRLVVFNLENIGCLAQGGTIDPATSLCTVVPANITQIQPI